MAHRERTAVVNGLSVDVEDYFQVSAFERVVDRSAWDGFDRRVVTNTERLLSIFSSAGVQATFFVLGWIAEREPGLMRRIAAQGHEIACHGYWHRLVYDQTPKEFREDVRRAKAILEGIVGRPVLGYRAPSFSITGASLWALEVLAEEGFAYDASIFPIRHDRYGIPGATRHPHRVDGHALLEIPASTVRIAGVNLPVAGGGYFRLLPYWWTRWGVRHVNEVEGKAVVFYMHPWEVDPGQPRLRGSTLGRFRHYRNLARTEPRLARLLTEFRFRPLSELVGLLAADATNRVQ
jgi:polysaccharide deacetylase family protein (PEP-CTERM system associated)